MYFSPNYPAASNVLVDEVHPCFRRLCVITISAYPKVDHQICCPPLSSSTNKSPSSLDTSTTTNFLNFSGAPPVYPTAFHRLFLFSRRGSDAAVQGVTLNRARPSYIKLNITAPFHAPTCRPTHHRSFDAHDAGHPRRPCRPASSMEMGCLLPVFRDVRCVVRNG